MFVNVDIHFKDCFPAYTLKWTPPHGEIANCQQTAPDCYPKTFDFEHPCFIPRF